jgi:acyl-CoA thioester hydrolase
VSSRLRVPLRGRDVDELGHLNQAVYHELLEEGRAALFAPVREDEGFRFAQVRIELDYKREVRLADREVEVVARVARLGRSSVTVTHEILLPDGTVAAEGLSVLVAWDPEARGARELTEWERARLGALPSGDQ